MDEPETTFLTSLFNNVEYSASVNERIFLEITIYLIRFYDYAFFCYYLILVKQ